MSQFNSKQNKRRIPKHVFFGLYANMPLEWRDYDAFTIEGRKVTWNEVYDEIHRDTMWGHAFLDLINKHGLRTMGMRIRLEKTW